MTQTEEEVRIGNDAAMVLDNAAYQLAIKQMHDEIHRNWKAADVRDVEGQTLILQMSKVADLFELSLKGLVERGKFAKSKLDLDSLRAPKEPKSWVRKVIG